MTSCCAAYVEWVAPENAAREAEERAAGFNSEAMNIIGRLHPLLSRQGYDPDWGRKDRP